MKRLQSTLTTDTGRLGTAEIIGAKTGGTSLDPLSNPAAAGNIIEGKEAYDDQGNKITGTMVDPMLTPLENGAAAADIIAGKEAYGDDGIKITGTLNTALAALASPAAASDIAAGKEAYDDQKNKITGTLADGNEVYY